MASFPGVETPGSLRNRRSTTEAPSLLRRRYRPLRARSFRSLRLRRIGRNEMGTDRFFFPGSGALDAAGHDVATFVPHKDPPSPG